jgi:hypothetical protein
LKMDLTEGSETSANIKQTLGKHPKGNTVNYLLVLGHQSVILSEDG